MARRPAPATPKSSTSPAGPKRVACLRTLLGREQLGNAGLKLDAGCQPLRVSRRNGLPQFIDLLRLRCVGKDRQLKLTLEIHNSAPGIVASRAALIGQRANLLTLRISEIEGTEQRQCRATCSRSTAPRTSSASTLWGLRNSRNRYSGGEDDRRKA